MSDICCFCGKEVVGEEDLGPMHEPTDNMQAVHNDCLMQMFREMRAKGNQPKAGKWLPLAYELYNKANGLS